MSDCKLLEGCPFFKGIMAQMPETSELMKQRYCKGDYRSCARHMVFEALGREAVPANLFPNRTDRARELINAKTAHTD